MCKLRAMYFGLLVFIGCIQPGICDSNPEGKEKSSIIKKAFKQLKGKRQSKKEEPPAKTEELAIAKDIGELSAQDILTALKSKSILSKSSMISKVLNTEGSALAAKQIIFVMDDNHRPYVIKRFNTHKEFLMEKKILEKVNQDIIPKIKKLEADLGWDYKLKHKFPTITSGKAYPDIDRIGVIVLEMGVGNTLYDGFIEKLSTIEDKKIIEAFTSIGEQFGNLDKAFYNRFKEILLHGDAHAKNFTYDDFTKTLYWIDTSGMSLSDKKLNKQRVTGINKLFFLEQIAGPKERNDQLEEWLESEKKLQEVEKVENISSLSFQSKKKLEEDLEKIKLARAKDMLAIESFREGYISANPAQKADCDASIEEILGTSDAFVVSKKLEDIKGLMQSTVPDPDPDPAPAPPPVHSLSTRSLAN